MAGPRTADKLGVALATTGIAASGLESESCAKTPGTETASVVPAKARSMTFEYFGSAEATPERISRLADGFPAAAPRATSRYAEGTALQTAATISPALSGTAATAAWVIRRAWEGCVPAAAAATAGAVSGDLPATAPTIAGATVGRSLTAHLVTSTANVPRSAAGACATMAAASAGSSAVATLASVDLRAAGEGLPARTGTTAAINPKVTTRAMMFFIKYETWRKLIVALTH